ncbi:MAG: DUF3341 domain-containing protein [Bacteroidota bacterium]
MEKNFLYGKFWSPDHALKASKELHAKGVLIYDVFSPFPIHGIEPYLNIKRSRLAIAAFILGLMGATLAVTCMSLIYGSIWPMNIGGKPALAFPDFVPITFEMTVFFASHGMVLTFFMVGNYWPGKEAKLFDDRQTDDVFVIAVDEEKVENEEAIKAVMKDSGAYEIGYKNL